ncbi:MAG: hypothetical protein ACLQVD_14330 [Capsulimonadaceae bacterium]
MVVTHACATGCSEEASLECGTCEKWFCYNCLQVFDGRPICNMCLRSLGRDGKAAPDTFRRLVAGMVAGGVVLIVAANHLVQMLSH